MRPCRPLRPQRGQCLISPKHHAHTNPDLVVKRTRVCKVELPRLTKIANKVEVVFEGAVPIPFEDRDLTELDQDIAESNE